MSLIPVSNSYRLSEERIHSLPENFTHSITSVSTATEIDPYALIRSTKRVPRWQFRSMGVTVLSSKPISIRLERGEELYFAENENIGIFATGKTVDEAIEDFCQHLIHFYRYYKQLRWDQLTGQARKLKEIYENIFHEESV